MSGVPIELVPPVPVPVGLRHCFDRTRARGRHDHWHTDLSCRPRSCELAILV